MRNKGITLIALVITIIVMLILVAVTVTVAINGGLFKEASRAASDTEREAIYDQIVSAMVLTDNGKINVKGTYDAVSGMLTITETNPEGVTESTEEVTFKVQGKKGTYEYTITEEEILIGKKELENPEDKYYVGEAFDCPLALKIYKNASGEKVYRFFVQMEEDEKFYNDTNESSYETYNDHAYNVFGSLYLVINDGKYEIYDASDEFLCELVEGEFDETGAIPGNGA